MTAANWLVLEPGWLGIHGKHRARCAAGHDRSVRPNNVIRRGAGCGICSRRDSETARAEFRGRVASQGGVVLDDGWRGVDEAHLIRCAVGHTRPIRPSNIQQGRGICGTCSGKDPEEAARQFRQRVEAAGATVLEARWQGIWGSYLIRCAVGHERHVYPGNLQQGRGICRACSGRAWDLFYVTENPTSLQVKFGITSGDGKSRLSDHARAGFTNVIAAAEVEDALAIEREVRSVLAAQGFAPIRGREYFDQEALPTIVRTALNLGVDLL